MVMRSTNSGSSAGVMEYWSVGLHPSLHQSNTPYSNSYLLPPHRHVDGIDAGVGQRFVVDAVVQAPEQLMPPHETSRRIFRKNTHRLGEILTAFFGIELLLLFVE